MSRKLFLTEMMYYDTVDISKLIDINKTNESRQSFFFFFFFFDIISILLKNVSILNHANVITLMN